MMAMNALKVLGVLALLGDTNPLIALAVVGVGAAAYAPAKYGLVAETVLPRGLVAANGWIEGTTVCAALFGAVLGGWLVGPMAAALADVLWPDVDPLSAALVALLTVYGLSAVLNLGVRDSGVRHAAAARQPLRLLHQFSAAQRTVWRDADGALSMAVTTLFWGVAAVLQVGVLRWAEVALGLPLEQAAYLQAAVAVGVIASAAWAGRNVPLHRAGAMLPLGLLLGLLLPAVVWVDSVPLALVMLVAVGAAGGALVVPLNALVQHRGHSLLTAGRSIAVQNFNENSSILVMLALYAALLAADMPIQTVLALFGGWVAVVMAMLMCRTQRRAVQRRAGNAGG